MNIASETGRRRFATVNLASSPLRKSRDIAATVEKGTFAFLQ
jgi:hypothetical protein